jgi:hypothetical protein
MTKSMKKRMEAAESERRNKGGQLLAGAGRAGLHKTPKDYNRRDYKAGKYD